MRRSFAPLVATLAVVDAQTQSSKRGLLSVSTSTGHVIDDDKIWVRDGADLTWYYNYGAAPLPLYGDKPQEDFEFVPMLWGAIDDTSFLDSVNDLINGGRDIQHVLGFNEPDGTSGTGGSSIDPATAAEVWVRNIAPLREKGVRVGLPACTGGRSGIPWLRQFLAECSALLSTDDQARNCTYDFVTIHWYGNFEGLASHLGEYSAAFPNKPQWVTEFALNDQDLDVTQAFFNTTLEYLDRLENVARYSYFGAFRSEDSNVGPNVVMLNNDGQLTDIGSWYLGGAATGVEPQTGTGAQNQAHVLLALALALVGVHFA
ncbi:glycoside hydrolase family 128 protein [Poronia punctata]|nr:glycoside hydrolase family 128 protein [Poronia punctata]